jgi:hypothetical protein
VTARRAGALALLLAAPMTRAAVAAAAPSLELAITACERFDEARLRELVAIEMGTIAARGAGPAGAPTMVGLACDGERAAIEVAGAEGNPASRAELNLAEAAPPTRLRLLALAITEAVAQRWAAERAAVPAAPPPPAPQVVAASLPPAAETPRLSLFVGPSARRMARPATWLAGVDVGAARALGGGALALVADARFETGEGATPVARVGWRQVTLTGALAVGVTRARWAAHLLPGWSVGFASLTGRPDGNGGAVGSTISGTWSGPSLALRARRDLGRFAFVSLDVATGYVTRRVVGLVDGDQPIFEVRGAWALAGLTGGVTF